MQDRAASTIIKKQPFISTLPFYYGWVILVVGAIGVLASIPGQTMGVSVFTDHYIRELSLTRVGVSGSYMVGTLASSLIIPFAGIAGAIFTLALTIILILTKFRHVETE